jgi:hypothetical protein
MSANNFTPDSYSGDNIGAAGYGATAIGTHQSMLPTGGVVANPNAYTAGSSSSQIQSGGKKSIRKSMRKSQSCFKWGGKKSTRRSMKKSKSCVNWGGKKAKKNNLRKSKRA